jgi:beta-glucosidase-like glycosyl hydrolase
MKKLSLFLAVVMVLTSIGLTGLAETSPIKESASGFYYIEAEGDRPRLSAASADKFMQVDGEWFKDMNGNGALDAYEDWRLTSEERTADLLTKMSLEQKTGTLSFGGIGGKNGITVTNLSKDDLSTGQTGVSFIQPDSEQMNNETDPYIVVDGVTYAPVAYQIKTMYETTMIAAMTGMPKDQLDVLNKIQSIAEDTELGIPVVFSGDRTYNTWGGMIDAAHYAFGVARDEELLYNLYSEYAKESVALGYHQVFHGYGNEIGSFYGDDPNYIAKMSALETRAYEDNGFNSHSKHFIARGGRNSYTAARSPADLIDSWMVGWKAVVDAGTQWIMTNNNVGRTEGLQTYFDKETYSLLRDDLGYNGIICLDWPLSASSLMSQTGITTDGIDISTLTLGERYTLILDVGIDMFSCAGACKGVELNELDDGIGNCYHPDAIIAEIEAGKYTEEELDVHVARVLKNKFDLGIFENPYRDWEEAVAVIGEAAANTDIIPVSNEEINELRRPEITAMEEQLMVESTILLKNDDVLPLSADKKVYVDSTADASKEKLSAAFAERGTLVSSLEEADVCVIEVSSFNDAYELMIEDAQDAGVAIVTVFEGTNSSEPDLQAFMDADALIMQTYRNTPDHGSSIGSFYRYVTPSITVEMLYGEKEPTGKTLFELAYDADDETLSWGELQDDIGVDTKTRLYMAMLAKNNPNIEMPNNLGDVIVTTDYGMSYTNAPDIQLSLLTLPQHVEAVEVESYGSTSTQTSVVNTNPKAGEPFEINFVAENKGSGAGIITVEVKDGDTVIAEKLVGLTEGQFRVISMDIVLEAGEHTITVGDLSATIVVE